MEALRGIAEVIEHILYELLGLLVPGAAMAVAVSLALGLGVWGTALGLAGSYWWLGLGVAYVLGYVTQGISRPVTNVFERLFLLPSRGLRALARKLPPGGQERLRRWEKAFDDFLLRRHDHGDRPPQGKPVDVQEIARRHWESRLGITDGRTLSALQVTDLSFSALLGRLGRLDRFRAATSLCRGTATAVAVAFSIVLARIILEGRPPTWTDFLVLEGLAIAFYGLIERADFYHGQWTRVILPQFLVHTTSGEAPAKPPETTAGTVYPSSTGGSRV